MMKFGFKMMHFVFQSTRAESLQVIHYNRGQRYNAHFDAYDKSTARGQVYI